ncbi:phage tail tube protein [Lactobacillus sp. PV034]|uniref:phage tail tube protein n=1 Tax=Lactobacillus sp. PV034 TaxID=2594495 RepID=UPI002240D138|nr:phage tail tube protein [Lactobacillus sp. PV034]QNQ80781.1 phage tail protein [Lactobacillus sp. PV034]
MMAVQEFMNGRDAISTKDATLTVEIDGQVYKVMECNKFTAKWEKNKEDVQTLGSHVKRKKTTSIEGTGTLGGYLVNSLWLQKAIPYVNDGSDLYFTATLTIEDKTSKTGKQVVMLTEVNLDDINIADFEADDGVMEWESDFTFEGSQVIQAFDGLE